MTAIPAEDVAVAGSKRSFTLPIDHHAAKWICDQRFSQDIEDAPHVYMTIDGDGGRWSGVLMELRVHRSDERTAVSAEWWPAPFSDGGQWPS